MSRFAEGFLSLVGTDEPSGSVDKAFAFRRFVLLAAAVDMWITEPAYRPNELLIIVVYTVAAGIAWSPRTHVLGTRIAFLSIATLIAYQFPEAHNHLVLAGLLLGAAALMSPGAPGEDVLTLQAGRWLIVVVLFWSGAQKLLHGCYFDGQFLAYAIATGPRFADFFGLFLPTQVADLQQMPDVGPGSGPYVVDSILFRYGANLVWIAEIALAIGLLVPLTRTLAVIGAIALVIGIEAGAREAVFGILFLGGLLSFLRGDVFVRCFPTLCVLLAICLVVDTAVVGLPM